MMAQRIITALIGLVVFFGVIFCPTPVFYTAVILVIFMALWELYQAMQADIRVRLAGLVGAGLILMGGFFNAPWFGMILSIMIYLVMSVYLHPGVNHTKIYTAAFGTYFITFFLMPLMWLRRDFGIAAVILVFVFSWITDSGAYFAGRFFGKHKLMPKVSPKKTVEGAIGGVITAILGTCLYFFVLEKCFSIEAIGTIRYGLLIPLALLCSILSQFGDLAASVIKRDCGVKDFGSILPGHGGVLDRFDSVIFITPMVFYTLNLFYKM